MLITQHDFFICDWGEDSQNVVGVSSSESRREGVFFFLNQQEHRDNENSEGYRMFSSRCGKKAHAKHVALNSELGRAVMTIFGILCLIGLSYVWKMGYVDLEAAENKWTTKKMVYSKFYPEQTPFSRNKDMLIIVMTSYPIQTNALLPTTLVDYDFKYNVSVWSELIALKFTPHVAME